MHCCAVIPVYNHAQAVVGVVQAVRQHGLACVLVNDGSDAHCTALLSQLADDNAPSIKVLHLPQNLGKGGAMMAGLRAAQTLGYSHALQIDADGQHNTADIPSFLAQAQAQPHALICGCPRYDASVPKLRLYGRYATHIWVWINTLSLAIRDAMCGFRVYPLSPVIALLDEQDLGQRMDFDIEILVRLHWRGLTIISHPTQVHYPRDGISHFQPWRDNVRISQLHTKLFFGMLRRLPQLLRRKGSGDEA